MTTEVILILIRDTTELLAAALGFAAIFCVVKGRYCWSAPLASAALLNR
jgi:hypothetical protein